MKATIERATLLKSLGHVQSVVERRNTIPILSNVLMEARVRRNWSFGSENSWYPYLSRISPAWRQCAFPFV